MTVVAKSSKGRGSKKPARRNGNARASQSRPKKKVDIPVPSSGLTTRQFIGKYILPQWLRTALVTLMWLGLMNVYVGLIAPYSVYTSARTMGIGLAIATAILTHLWPTRTSPWRTSAWIVLVSTVLGSMFLQAGLGRFSLAAVTIVGFGFLALRVNENGRKLWDAFQTWRALR